ncbi:GNAT family N-acetyltransferase [Paenibacillus antarcticus]|uniref:N-acetyltransferase domain-containing protein n=1 Tax=Paenibacillus antarcticus TaxID=253703 RepID=A0A162KE16_9BACL|nr:GNAT family N-acetyltransferase [Paenibacillus antarcticus]OAB45188.1 hypothetical protein PBAT_14725 [Paenibacillus antarcticus]
MGFTNGSTPFDRYELSDQFYLQKADKKEWNLFFSVYYNAEYISFFKEMALHVLRNIDPFWICKGRMKIGGVVISANQMCLLYFIPPFHEQGTIVHLLKNVLLKWSDTTLPIHVYEVLQDQVDLFARAGFWPDEQRFRWMQRPTETLECEWDRALTVVQSLAQDEPSTRTLTKDKEIGHLFYRCYSDSIRGMNNPPKSISQYISETQSMMKEASTDLLRASTLVYDKRNNALIGACLVSMHQDLPSIQQLGVLPTYRGRGMGSNMIKRSLTVLKDLYPYLRVHVMQGNPVESVYYNLGFVPGLIVISRMLVPVK